LKGLADLAMDLSRKHLDFAWQELENLNPVRNDFFCSPFDGQTIHPMSLYSPLSLILVFG